MYIFLNTGFNIFIKEVPYELLHFNFVQDNVKCTMSNELKRDLKNLIIKIIILTLICIKWDPEDPDTTFLATSSTRKMPECLDSMNSSIFMPENT